MMFALSPARLQRLRRCSGAAFCGGHKHRTGCEFDLGGGGLSASLAQIARIESQDVQIYPLLPAGVRRLIVIEPETRRVEGIVSLSDIAAYLLL